MIDACTTCGRPMPEGRLPRGWRLSPYADRLLCPEHAPPLRADTPEIKRLRVKLKELRAERAESDDPDERASLAEEIEELREEIDHLRDDLDALDFPEVEESEEAPAAE